MAICTVPVDQTQPALCADLKQLVKVDISPTTLKNPSTCTPFRILFFFARVETPCVHGAQVILAKV